jgi:hypothetical protein
MLFLQSLDCKEEFRMKSIEEMYKEGIFCECKAPSSITAYTGEWGYYDVCCGCGKPLEDGFHYYNHYDGEDHDDIDIW